MIRKRFTMGKKNNYWYIRDGLEDVYHHDMTLPNDIANVCSVLNEQHEIIIELRNQLLELKKVWEDQYDSMNKMGLLLSDLKVG